MALHLCDIASQSSQSQFNHEWNSKLAQIEGHSTKNSSKLWSLLKTNKESLQNCKHVEKPTPGMMDLQTETGHYVKITEIQVRHIL